MFSQYFTAVISTAMNCCVCPVGPAVRRIPGDVVKGVPLPGLLV